MTWADVLLDTRAVRSIFQWVNGAGSQNDNLLRMLEKMTADNATINDLFARQRLSRAALIAIIEARVQRRLA